MKRYLLLACFVAAGFMFVSGCSLLSELTKTAASDNRTSYSLSGSVSAITLYGSSVSSQSDSSQPNAGWNQAIHSAAVPQDANNMMLLFQNQVTEEVFLGDIDSSGEFSFDVEVTDSSDTGDTFYVALLQQDPLEYLGTIVGNTDTGVSGITIQEALTDLEIHFDEDKNLGSATSNGTTMVFDENFKIRFDDDGNPIGVSTHGKGDDSKTTDTKAINKLDPDEDGIPNIFDAMDNGQDLDNTRTDTRLSAVAGSSVASYASMFMNYKIDYTDVSTATVTNNAIITIEVVAADASKISSIVADIVHTNYQSSTIAPFPVGFTEIDTYPTTNTTWTSESYQLYQAQNFDGDDIWTVFLYPKNNTFDVGDLIRLKATLTDGTIEYYWVSINFKFQTTLTDSTSWIHGGTGSNTDPFQILSTGGRVFSWSAPTDETGTGLTGLDYDFELFFLYGTTPETVLHTGNYSYDIGTDATSGSIAEATIDMHNSSSPSVNVLQVDIKASYPYGDNAALKYYMARPSW